MTALASISLFWLVMAVTVVTLLSYLVSLFLDTIFGRDGFGTIGNIVILTGSFFGGIIIAEYFGYRVSGLQMHTYLGLAASLGGFLLLAIIKQIVERIFNT